MRDREIQLQAKNAAEAAAAANGVLHKSSCFPDQAVQHKLSNGMSSSTSNGTANGYANGTTNKAADYYVKGDVPADASKRKTQ